jgi:hypothetical protein
MYGVTDLSKMYGVTRVTMYKHLKNKDLQEYLVQSERGLRLEKEGLNVLNNILGQATNKKAETTVDVDLYKALTDEKERRIKGLEEEIRELKLDKTRLYEELREQRALLTGSKEHIQRKGFLKRLFR